MNGVEGQVDGVLNVALVFAGGIGSRVSSAALPKQFLEVHGKPVIIHTLEHFDAHPEIHAIAVAILPQWRHHFMRLMVRYELSKVNWLVDGGATGQLSRQNALEAVSESCPPETVVLMHDGVRPLIDAQLISDNIASVREHGSGITCTKLNETVVSSAGEVVDAVVPRTHLYTAQAPQSFRLGEITSVYRRALADGEEDTIDSCSLMRRYGYDVRRVPGPASNIKITTAADFYTCRAFFEMLENRQIGGL